MQATSQRYIAAPRWLSIAIAAIGLGAASAQAGAPPVLTAAGISLGFTLDTIVSGLPTDNGNSYDVLGSAINSDGNIILNNSRTQTNYVFRDINNQTAADALGTAPFTGFASAFAYANGSVWASAVGGSLARLNNDGSIAQIYSTIPANQGLWTNPVTGHLIAGNPLLDINVSGVTPTFTTINASFSADGVTVSPDGNFAYGSSGQIVNLANGSSAGSLGVIPGGDGMGIIASSNPALNGNIIANSTAGLIIMIDKTTFAQTIIAQGGGYGDYTSPDYTNGTLLVSSSNNLLRLGCGASCAIGVSPVPEPESYAMLLAGFGLMGFVVRRRRQSAKVA